MKKVENLAEDNRTCDCHYLLTIRLALQKEVDSPFGINSIYGSGDWCAPWWCKPVSYADLDVFFESRGCGQLRQSIGIGSWRDVAGGGGKAERTICTSLEQHGLILERARAHCGKRYVSEARKWAETVAFFATGCSFLDIVEVADGSVAQVSREIYGTWYEDYYIGCVDNITKLTSDSYLVHEWGPDEDGAEPDEVIVLEEYMEGISQGPCGPDTLDVHDVQKTWRLLHSNYTDIVVCYIDSVKKAGSHTRVDWIQNGNQPSHYRG